MSKSMRLSKASFRSILIAASLLIAASISVYVAFAAISISTTTPYTQNFDGMGTSGTATLPTDWRVDKPSTVRTVGTFAAATTTTNLAGGANLSSTASNGIYNFGSGTTTTGPDRAVGFLSSGTATSSGNLYAQLVNSTAGNLSGVQISYDVEKYRNGSNPNGFRVQMFYSLDGTTWTSAGSDFLTSFGADANNSGFATAPGATVSVTNKTLNVFVGSGSNLYLAWNYSVTATSTTTNAQALAIDNVSILGIAGGGSTNPTGTGAANPSSVDQGGTTLLTVAVTPGSNPTSMAHTVTANLSSIGGSSSQSFFDDGTHGDATSGDNTFSFSTSVSNGTTPGPKTLPVTIQETGGLNRTGGASISLTVNTPTPPTGVGAASPSTVQAGNSSLLTVSVTPGTHPTSTGLAVSANLSSIGGSASQQFFDNGTNGDVTAGDNVFSFNATVSSGTSAGAKNIPATISDGQSRSGSANIALNVTSATTSPTGTGNANPSSVQIGGTTLLTVNVSPGQGPDSTGLSVSADLSAIGGSATQQFFDNGTSGDLTAGDNIFSYTATVALSTTTGAKTLPFTISDDQARSSSGNIALTVTPQTVPAGSIAISQVYGGGGNAGATLTNDFIEIFNRSQNSVSLAGWSVQYASAGGGATAVWNRKTPLSGVINPGQYFLISEAAGNGGSVPLPTADVTGSIMMGATDGKVALVSNANDLPNGCPIGNSNLVDFIGYGSADCFEGAAAAQVLTNTTANFRKRGGCQDTNSNVSDFIRSAPNPRNSSTTVNVCPATGDFAPGVESTTPTNGATGVENDANITVTFDEPVNVTSNWFQISCSVTGNHTAVITGGPTTFTINPDIDFGSAEQCTVTINHNEVSDQDLIDPPDNMDADYSFTFATAIVRDPAEHMVMGNPSGAVNDVGMPLNYLMMKPQYALSYNNDKGTTNWTSWHLDNTWTTGVADRQNDFRSDDTLPPDFKHVSNGYNFATYGFDRGHMCPSADRTSSVADNSATFLMTNMVPQASGNNQGPWAAFENYIRAQLNGATNELYILSGPAGVGGNSSTGHWDSIMDTAGNSVTVPNKTWKVVMVLPNAAGDDVSRVDNSTRTFAVIMPNDDDIRPDQWQKYLATVRQVETLTGYNFFSNVPQSTQDVIEPRLDVINDTAPVADSATTTTAEDNGRTITLSASDFNVNNVLTFSVATGPTHGSVGAVSAPNCSNGNCTATVTYTPAANYNGPDSFTFTVNDGALDSGSANVSITVSEVNDDPVPVNDGKTTAEDSALNFAASDLTSNDSPGPNESGQTLTVDSVISTPNTHGSVSLAGGQITYTPDANYNGAASFDYQVCDNGSTNGSPDSKCATGTVTVTITEVNDNPVPGADNKGTSEDTTLNFPASDLTANDSAGPADESGQTLTVTSVTATANTHGTVSLSAGTVSYVPEADYNGPASFEYQVCDNGTSNGSVDSKCATGTVNVTVTETNDNPVANADSKSTNEDTSLNFPASDLTANDSAGPANESSQTLTVTSVTPNANTHGIVSMSGATVTYSPTSNYNGPAGFDYQVCDNGRTNGSPDSKCATGSVSVAVNPINDPPTANSQSVYTNGNTPVLITLTGSDVETPSGNLTYRVTPGSGPSHGTLTGVAPNLIYTPALNYCGVDSFRFTVTDTGDGSSPPLTSPEAIVSINVNDTIPPTITLNGNQISLWPANHSYHTVNVTDLVASATDSCDPNVNINSVVIAHVTSDEVENGNGDGNTTNDIVIAADCKSVQLRAEREAGGDGRVYTLTFLASDASGNTSVVNAKVIVPKSNGGDAIDSGPHYTVTSSCH